MRGGVWLGSQVVLVGLLVIRKNLLGWGSSTASTSAAWTDLFVKIKLRELDAEGLFQSSRPAGPDEDSSLGFWPNPAGRTSRAPPCMPTAFKQRGMCSGSCSISPARGLQHPKVDLLLQFGPRSNIATNMELHSSLLLPSGPSELNPLLILEEDQASHK